MKSFALIVVLAQVAIFQTYAQVLRPAPILPSPVVPGPCGCGSYLPSPVITSPQIVAAPQLLAPQVLAPQVLSSPQLLVQPNSVANNLADTLSLLTVSSLLAESLPLGYPNVVSVPVASPTVLGGCGCGYNYPLYL